MKLFSDLLFTTPMEEVASLEFPFLPLILTFSFFQVLPVINTVTKINGKTRTYFLIPEKAKQGI
ncbi:MAG: hypothetical protein BGP13_05640 [Sphingobacteriales bacterium 40-81]|nr:MAG: hypothetical protein BGP13_05640 [Sphingobacteriales bacterium 40-81]